jgi:hypothetical protein
VHIKQMSAFRMTRVGAGLHSPSGADVFAAEACVAALLSHSAAELKDLAAEL